MIKFFMRNIDTPGIETICLSNFISFTQDEMYRVQAYEINAIDRLVNNIKERVRQLKDEENRKEQFLQISLSLLVLSNLCQSLRGIDQFLHVDDQEQRCVNFKILLNYFMDEQLEEGFHFFANIIANISGQKESREILVSPEFRIFEVFRHNCFH